MTLRCICNSRESNYVAIAKRITLVANFATSLHLAHGDIAYNYTIILIFFSTLLTFNEVKVRS